MDTVADTFFTVTTRDDGTRSLAPADWRTFAARARDFYTREAVATLRELATLALFCEQRGERIATAALCRLASSLDARFAELWTMVHADAVAEQERRQRALGEFVGGKKPRALTGSGAARRSSTSGASPSPQPW